MIGDVKTAEKKFRDLVGGRTNADTLLKRLSDAEAKNLKGQGIQSYLDSKLKGIRIILNDDNLDVLFGREKGIIYLLSTRPHTDSNSNYIKLVKNKVLECSEELKEYLKRPLKISNNIKNVKDSLLRYLKLTGDEKEDEIPEGETVVTDKLTRKKNEDVAQKLQSHRMVNRLKVMVTAIVINLIEYAEKNPIIVDTVPPHILTGQTGGNNKSSGGEAAEKKRKEEEERQAAEKRRKEEAERQAAEKKRKEEEERQAAEKRRKEEEERQGAEKRRKEEAEKRRKEEAEKKRNMEERWKRLDEGKPTLEEFNELSRYDAINMKKIIIPQGAKEIKEGFFEEFFRPNENLREVFIPKSVEHIGKSAFYKCTELTSLTIEGGGHLVIDENAFTDCKKLTRLHIPSSVKSIGGYAFSGCESLSDLTVENGLQIIGKGAFLACRKIKNVIIPGSVQVIGDSAFCVCERLDTVIIGNGALKIGGEAFKGCENLKTITVPESVTSIGDKAFDGCPKNIEVLGGASEEIKNIIREQAGARDKKAKEDEAWRNRVSETINKLEVGKATKEEYDEFVRYCEKANDYKYKILENVKKLVVPQGVSEMYCDYRCRDNLQYVEIPSSVNIIRNWCFEECKKLTDVKMAEGIKKIGGRVFKDCIILANIKLPETLTSIGEFAFAGCAKLSSIIIPNKVSELAKSVFDGCTGLQEIEIGNGVSIIRDYTFKNCTSLKQVEIPDRVTEIGAGAFSGCASLEKVVLGSDVGEIQASAFKECKNLKKITVPKSVYKIGLEAFKGCPKDMQILGDVSEERKGEILEQIGAKE